MKPHIAVILFPGTNDDENSARAVRAAGMDATIVRWNETAGLERYDGYVLPGGWSYEDRIRAGVIAAKEECMRIIKHEAQRGKPVLGICNGAQILIETGMVPGVHDKIEMALAPNENPFVAGYYCAWTHLKAGGNCVFVRPEDGIIRIPFAHGEGRFTTRDPQLIEQLERNGQIVLRYCTPEGVIDPNFPINPNGAVANIAGLANVQGNVLAIMPHPERASWMFQLPEGERSAAAGPGRILFTRMREYVEGRQ